MKKIFLSLFLVICFAALVACGDTGTVSVTGLEVSGQKVEFVVGDAFDKGDLVVTAKMSDATTIDVTSKADVVAPESLNVVGTYAVLVKYDNYSVAYQINVAAKVESVESVLVDTANAKLTYKLGDTVSLEGLAVYEVYASKVEVADLAAYEVNVYNEAGEEVESFEQVGTYKVVVAKDQLSASYYVNVKADGYDTIADAIEVAIENANKVNGGVLVHNNAGYETVYNYTFGANNTQIESETSKFYFETLEEDEVFGVEVYVDTYDNTEYPSLYYGATTANLLGVDLRDALGYSYDIFGVETLVDTLYVIGAEDASYKESFVVCPVCGEIAIYAFAYEMMIDGYYYVINVEFTMDTLNNAIETVNVEMKGYYYDSVQLNEETGKYEILTDVADFGRVISASQTFGERTAENPYSADKCLYDSFELEDAEGNKVTEDTVLSLANGSSIELNLVNAKPEGVIAGIDNINVLVTDEEGFETWSVFGSYDYGIVSIGAYAMGNYVVTVQAINYSVSFNLTVEPASLESFAVGQENDWGGLDEITKATVFAGVNLTLSVIANDGADRSFTAQLKEASDAVTLDVDGYDCYFVATEVGTYEVVFTSSVDSNFTASVVIEVVEAPSAAEILVGKYTFYSMMLGDVTYVFTPESEGAVKGTLTIDAKDGMAGNQNGTFTYEYVDGNLVVIPSDDAAMSCQFSVMLDGNYNLQCVFNGWEQGALTKVNDSDVEEGGLNGSYTATYVHPMNGMSFAMELSFNANGTGSYSLMNGMYLGSFNYSVDGQNVNFADVVALQGTTVELSATYANAIIACNLNFVDDGMELPLEFVAAGATPSEGPTLNPIVGTNQVNGSYFGEVCYFEAQEDGNYTFSIDESVGVLGIDYEMAPSHTLFLFAGNTVEIVVLTNANDGVQVVTIVIDQA